MRTLLLSLCGVILTASLPATSVAGKFNKVLSIGDAAPAWEGLPGIDGKRHSLADIKDAKAVVVIFMSTECPVAAGYEERFVTFAKSYRDKGVAVVAINVSERAMRTLEKMKRRGREKAYNFPYLHDPSQQIGRKYGAWCTPHVFLLDKDRKIVYMGAFDDHNDAASAKKRYLQSAVDAVLNGKRPETSESRPRGCPIEYDTN